MGAHRIWDLKYRQGYTFIGMTGENVGREELADDIRKSVTNRVVYQNTKGLYVPKSGKK